MLFSPKKTFLLDAIGAVLSTLLLGVVLVHFESYIGMPLNVLYPLAAVAGVFAVYSFSCYFFLKTNWKPYMRNIAIANSIYCLASIILVIIHFDLLTTLGIIYFISEFLILILIILTEFKTIKKSTSSKKQ